MNQSVLSNIRIFVVKKRSNMLNKLLLLTFMGTCLARSPLKIEPFPDNECPEGQVRCTNVDKCIFEVYQCDGFSDCTDNSNSGENSNSQSQEDKDDAPSDEGEHCRDFQCLAGWSKCDDQLACVKDDWFCDGWANCIDGSDESQENCPQPPVTDPNQQRRSDSDLRETRMSAKNSKYSDDLLLEKLTRLLKRSRI